MLVSFPSPILPISVRAGYPGTLVSLCEKFDIDFIPVFPRGIFLGTKLLPVSQDKVEKSHLAKWINTQHLSPWHTSERELQTFSHSDATAI